MKLFNLIIFLIILICNISYSQNTFNDRKQNFDFDTNKVYPSYFLDKEPSFPGGKDSLANYIHQNFKLTKKNMEFEGFICICLTFDCNGIIIGVQIPGETESSLFSSEFETIFKKGSRWKPGEINGIHVKCMLCIPIFIKFI